MLPCKKRLTEENFKACIEALWAGEIIAYPTEAVWGLGCDPWQEEALRRLLALKGRAPTKGLIVIAASCQQIWPLLAPLPEKWLKRMQAPAKRPVTWLVADPQNWLPNLVRGNHAKVAVRLTEHPVARALCHGFGAPIISTSANYAGRPPLLEREAVVNTFGDKLGAVSVGGIGSADRPSIIQDLETGSVLRR